MPVQDRYKAFLTDQRQFFDELITEDWETYKNAAWDCSRNFEVSQLFKKVQPRVILDIGSGVGYHDKVMADYPFVEHIDSIDYSEQSVLRATAEYPHVKIRRHVADFNNFIASQTYDLIISFQVFEHLNNPEAYFEFCARNCSETGYVAICTPNRLSLNNRIRLLQGQECQMVDIMHFKEYTVDEINTLGESFGFRPYGFFGHSLSPFSLWNKYYLTNLKIETRLKLGYLFPKWASIICVILKRVS